MGGCGIRNRSICLVRDAGTTGTWPGTHPHGKPGTFAIKSTVGMRFRSLPGLRCAGPHWTAVAVGRSFLSTASGIPNAGSTWIPSLAKVVREALTTLVCLLCPAPGENKGKDRCSQGFSLEQECWGVPAQPGSPQNSSRQHWVVFITGKCF